MHLARDTKYTNISRCATVSYSEHIILHYAHDLCAMMTEDAVHDDDREDDDDNDNAMHDDDNGDALHDDDTEDTVHNDTIYSQAPEVHTQN